MTVRSMAAGLAAVTLWVAAGCGGSLALTDGASIGRLSLLTELTGMPPVRFASLDGAAAPVLSAGGRGPSRFRPGTPAWFAQSVEAAGTPTASSGGNPEKADLTFGQQLRRVGRHFKKSHATGAWKQAFEPIDWLAYGGLTAATTLARQYDDSIRKNFDDRRVLGGAAHLDDWLVVGVPLASTVMLYAWPARDEDGRYDDLAAWSEVLAGTAAMSLATKGLVNRRRPNGEDNNSFPSMHVSMVAASAFFMDDLYREKYGWKVSLPMYATLGLVSVARMDRDKHWASDVLGGIAVGYFVENVIYNWHYGDGGVNRRVHLLPVISDDTVALVAWIPF